VMVVSDDDRFTVHRRKVYRRACAVWLAVTVGALIITCLVVASLTHIKRNEVKLLAQYEQKLSDEVGVLAKLQEEKTHLEVRTKELQKKVLKVNKVRLVEKNIPYRYLKEIAEIIPDQVMLDVFDFSVHDIQLEGHAHNIHAVMQFIRGLEQSRFFKDLKLVSMGSDELGQDVATKFVIHASKR
jgi:Tfp pilus assembly protein PilN